MPTHDDAAAPTSNQDPRSLSRILRLCVVCDFQGSNPVGAMARRVGPGMNRSVVFADTEASTWLYNPLMRSPERFEQAMNEVFSQVASSTEVHLHLELGLFGNSLELMRKNVLEVVGRSAKLVVFVHSLHMNDDTFAPIYKDILSACERKRETDAICVWVNNKKDARQVAEHFHGKVVLSPVMYFSRGLRTKFIKSGEMRRATRNTATRTIGVFGYINGHKDFETTLRAFSLLPENFLLKSLAARTPASGNYI